MQAESQRRHHHQHGQNTHEGKTDSAAAGIRNEDIDQSDSDDVMEVEFRDVVDPHWLKASKEGKKAASHGLHERKECGCEGG